MGEDIGCLVSERNKEKENSATRNVLTHKVTSNFNVFGVIEKNVIMSNLNRVVIIII